jgi:hypothetical protein
VLVDRHVFFFSNECDLLPQNKNKNKNECDTFTANAVMGGSNIISI